MTTIEAGSVTTAKVNDRRRRAGDRLSRLARSLRRIGRAVAAALRRPVAPGPRAKSNAPASDDADADAIFRDRRDRLRSRDLEFYRTNPSDGPVRFFVEGHGRVVRCRYSLKSVKAATWLVEQGGRDIRGARRHEEASH